MRRPSTVIFVRKRDGWTDSGSALTEKLENGG